PVMKQKKGFAWAAQVFIRLAFVWAAGVSLLLAGCRKTISSSPEAADYPGDNYPDIFQSFWNGMNTNYVFWGIDTTNWDNMYTVYKPLFDQLSIFDSQDESLAEQYFDQMTQGLIDSH